MSRYSNGWIKLYHSIWDHPVANDGFSFSLFVWLLHAANWKESRVKFNGTLTTLRPGQLVTSSLEICERLGFARATLDRKLKWLEECGSIQQQVSKHGRLITISNWDKYQGRDADDQQPESNQRASIDTSIDTTDEHPSRQPAGTYEEDKTTRRKDSKKGRRVTGALAPASPGSEVWTAYHEAYLTRYRVEPVRNAKTNSQCDQLAKRLGLELAQSVVRFYLTHQGSFYVRTSHALGPCVQDAEGLASQYQRGQRVTTTEAHKADRNQTNAEVFRSVFAELDAQGKLEKWKAP